MENTTPRTPFNFRPMCFWAFFVGLTIVACFIAIEVGLWVLLVWFAILCGGLGVQFGKNWRELSRAALFPAVALTLCVFAMVSFFVTHNHFTNQPYLDGHGEVLGIVRKTRINAQGTAVVTLSSITFKGERVPGRIRLNVPLVTDDVLSNTLRVGNVISTHVNLRPTDASSFNINNSFRYQGTVLQGLLRFERRSNDLRSIVLRWTHNFFHRHMSDTNAELMYSMLFGDRSSLDEEVRGNFALSGMAHVLAVSGMHVGLIVAIFVFLLNFLKVPRKWQFFIILALLGLYVFLADFRYSILRASIMFTVLLFNRLFLRRVDLLSSISFSAIIILVLFPFGLDSLSFQLSFACLLGIALFYRPVYDWHMRHLPKWRGKFGQSLNRGFSAAMALNIVTNIMIFPFLLGTFGNFPLISFVSNILLLPIITLSFQACVVALLTYVGYPLLWIVDRAIWFVLWASDWMGQLSWQRLDIVQHGFWYLFLLFGLVLLTRFVFFKKRIHRYLAVGTCFAIYTVSLVLQNI